MTYITDLTFEKVTFFWSQFYATLLLSSEHLSHILNVLIEVGAKNEYVIQIWDTYLVSEVSQTSLHVALKAGRGVGQPEWDPHPFIKSPWCYERGAGSAFLTHDALMVCFSLVQHREPGVATKVVKNLLNPRDGMTFGL